MTLTRLLAQLRGQDVLLVAWVALGWPLLAVVLGGGELGLSTTFDQGEPIRGLIWLLAVIGALVVVGPQLAGPVRGLRRRIVARAGVAAGARRVTAGRGQVRRCSREPLRDECATPIL